MSEEAVKKEWEQRLRASFQDAQALSGFMLHTLDSFAHRYLSAPQLLVQPTSILLESREENMGQALKSAQPVVKEAVKTLAKAVPREERPALVSRVRIDIQQLTADKGQLAVTAQLNWGHPDYAWGVQEKLEMKRLLQWDDLQQFRKGFPLALEEVCELFL